MESRLADADDRAVEYGARGIETGIVKAGEDCRISIGPLLELDQKAGNREGLVIVALDRGRPVRGRNGRDGRARRRRRFSRSPDRFRHGARGVRVDDE